MINSDCGSHFQAITVRPEEPVEHSEPGGEKCSVSGHSTEVRGLSVPAIIPRSPVHQPSGMPGQATVQRASVSTIDGAKTPVESSTCKYSEKVIEKANDLFDCLHKLTEIEVLALSSYSTDGLFPYLCPEWPGSLVCGVVSKKLTCLLSDEGLNGEEKDQTMRLVVKRFNESSNYSDFQKKMINDFFEGVFIYLKQKAVFNNWESKGAGCTSTATFYTSMHKLMTEGDKHEDDTSWFCFNNEVGYLDRCCSAFMFLINELTMHPDIEVNMALLNKAAGIIGSLVCVNENHYPVNVNKSEDNTFFAELLKKGRLYNKSDLSDKDFKSLLSIFFEEEMKKNGSSYFCIDDILKNEPEYNSQPPYFEFTFKESSNNIDRESLTFEMEYKSKDKQADCDELLKNYYKSVADKNEMLEIIEEVVSVCCEIQRRHPIGDGNGRLYFFILSSVLLYQKGIWLKETLYDPWLLIDSKPPGYIAAKLVDLCIKRPVFSSPLDWKAGLNEEERARVFCFMGELEEFKEIINRKPELLNAKLRTSNMYLLEAAAMNNRTEIVKFILENYPEKTSQNILHNLLNSYYSKNYEAELVDVIQNAIPRISLKRKRPFNDVR
ncbi:hypothetical protein NX722_16005 [Endozoicomonas gorgoniicola]|uniref:Fido domain-containing protein n=1 Tax=Endozoicomonas gorgoniicola TaxID=1234144 RepID=A0ABT3MXJ8_9GAMM|nr:hypothetical protein [Endozoicomonas gorgoniicola]MCW7554094.1 hypothetical protein [Endozoicomonas gorgoniicola]